MKWFKNKDFRGIFVKNRKFHDLTKNSVKIKILKHNQGHFREKYYKNSKKDFFTIHTYLIEEM